MADAGSAANKEEPIEKIIHTKIKDEAQLPELPPKVLLMIFARLDLPSRKNVVLVCKKWRDVAYDKNIWRNIFANVDLERITNRKVFVSFETRGIKRIEVNNLQEPGKKLKTMLRQVPNLRELQIRYCYDLSDQNLNYLHKFSNLRTLELHYARKITSESLKVVGRSLRELTTLSLCGCHLIKDAGIRHLTGANDKDSIQGSLKLKHLSLENCPEITNKSLRMIASKLLQLTKLELQYCNRITDKGVIFLTNGATLDELDLCDVGGISDISLKKIASGFPALNSLNISWNRTSTELTFTLLATMTCLKTLKIACCDVMGEWLAHLVDSKIETLSLAFNNDIKAEGLRHISGMSHLLELNLSSIDVDDEGLELLSHCPSKLNSLNLSYNNRITDAGVVHLAKLLHLKELDLSMCPNITSVGFLRLAEVVPKNFNLNSAQNFQRTLDCINQTIRKIEENGFRSEEWFKAIQKISEIEKMFTMMQPPVQ